jgi:Lon protease-like protein
VRLPLHIFEERYKEMFAELLETGGAFGVVLAQGNGILRLGCTATVQEVTQRYDDGRLDIVTRGVDRFSVREIDTSRNFPQARVELFNDDESDPPAPADLRRAVQANQEIRQLADSDDDPNLRDPQVSFQLAQVSPDLEFRQLLLALRSEAVRLGRVADHLEMLVLRHRHTDRARNLARTNGHGGPHIYLDDQN